MSQVQQEIKNTHSIKVNDVDIESQEQQPISLENFSTNRALVKENDILQNDDKSDVSSTVSNGGKVQISPKQNKGPNQQQPQKDGSTEMVAFGIFFRYLTATDKTLIIIGTISAVIAGCLMPSMAIVMGEITNTFDPDNTPDDIKDTMSTLAGYISLIGLGLWIFGYMYYAFWQHLAENISFNLRSRYLHAILKQEVAYFETQNVEQLPSQIGENFAIIQDAIGEKFSNIIFTCINIAAGIGIAFYKGADFAGICIAYVPLILISLGLFGNKVKTSAIEKIACTRKMGGIVEESLSAIRLISSFANEDKEIKKFEKLAGEVKEIAHRSEYWLASFIGMFRFIIFGFYVYTFWIATVFIENKRVNPNTGDPYTTGDLLCILVAMMTGMSMLFGLNPNVQAIVKAKVVGRMIFEVIDRKPAIRDHEGCVADFSLNQSIRFERVTFKYPLAPEKVRNVLEEASFQIKACQTTAIVGPSGSGKSTIIQMVERFYDPLAGEIFFDNTSIKNIMLKSLREKIGYVSQEPVLILGTIKDNLLFGNKDATQDDIDYAIKLANASFIYDMENGIDTFCGSNAVLNLSGGQKQRIAIARALIKRPQILILDEATSALDPKSEREVQGAIDKIASDESNRLTIIMIAHRLQTIMTAQNLLYLESKNSVVPATKGTPEYEDIMNRLQETNYAHQKDAEEKPNKRDSIKKQRSSVAKINQEVINSDESEDAAEIIEVNNKEGVSQNDLERKDRKDVGMLKIMSYYTPKWLSYCVYIVTIINAFAFPLYGLVFGKILFIMMVPQSKTFREDRDFWCGMFLLLTGCLGIFGFLNKFVYGYLGENLTYTIRNKLFASILYKHLGWFDNKERAPGVLSNTLSEDITQLNGLTSETIANLLEAFLTLVIGIVLAFIYTWHMALVSMGATPFVVVGAVIMSRLQWRLKKAQGEIREKGEMDPYEQANALLSDMLINYRTVISFGDKNVEYVMNRFDNLLEEPNKVGVRNAHLAGFWFGYSQCVRFFFLAFVFYIASIFIFDYGDKPDDTYIGLYILFVAAIGSGISISQAPSVSKAQNAASKVFNIIEEESKIDTRSTEGERIISDGAIELKNVQFRYPSRAKNVLNQMNMKIPATKKIALVGHSGCGKSTIANLLLRMYDVTDGSFMIDGIDIRKYNVGQLRKQIGIVMQEPLLFNMTIKQNILYGNDQASDQRVREVAEMANALAFIESNIEDLNQEEVQEKIEVQYREFINREENRRRYANYQELLTKYFNEKAFNIQEIQLILEILEKGDERLRNLINEYIHRFINLIKEVSQLKGIKWDDIVLRFEWTFEADYILDYLKSEEATQFKQVHKDAVNAFIKSHPTKFDLVTIKEFGKQLQFLEKPEHSIEILKKLVSDSFDRLKQQNNSRIKSLHQQNTYAKDFKLHEGFDKSCGLKGSMLSGGQKQRIAIARALIKDPKILILDEATSALDEQSQELVQQALDRAMEGRTSVVIAHRLSTVRNCEWLFVIHNGVVVEQGTYDELSANQNSYFYKLKSGMEM